jgi:hypothetical protein
VIVISAADREEITSRLLKRGAGISSLASEGMAVGDLTFEEVSVGMVDGFIEGKIVEDNEGS